MTTGWRASCSPIIARVLSENAGRSKQEIRAALQAAYPFGPRKYHPYKIWLDEIQRQTGKRPPLWNKSQGMRKPLPANPDQFDLEY